MNHLTPEEKRVLLEKGTEAPFSGKYYNETAKGSYVCKVCGNPLFDSTTKYETTTPGLMGWPSFDTALPGSVEYVPDDSQGMHRTEVVCSVCKCHLGHIFDDGEAKTGKHFCINSCALNLEKE